MEELHNEVQARADRVIGIAAILMKSLGVVGALAVVVLAFQIHA